MADIIISGILRDLLGENACEILSGACEATAYRVAYGAAPEAPRLGMFAVSSRSVLSPEETSGLCRCLTDDGTWEWEFVTRHLPIPEILIEFVLGNRSTVFLLDRRGMKLGYLRGREMIARDYVSGSPGGKLLSRIADSIGTKIRNEGKQNGQNPHDRGCGPG